jgi:hypothetical protein
MLASFLGVLPILTPPLCVDRAIKVFHDKQKLKQYMTTKPPLQKILQGILRTESEKQTKP